MERVGRASTGAEILVRNGRACLSGYPFIPQCGTLTAALRLVGLDCTLDDARVTDSTDDER